MKYGWRGRGGAYAWLDRDIGLRKSDEARQSGEASKLTKTKQAIIIGGCQQLCFYAWAGTVPNQWAGTVLLQCQMDLANTSGDEAIKLFKIGSERKRKIMLERTLPHKSDAG